MVFQKVFPTCGHSRLVFLFKILEWHCLLLTTSMGSLSECKGVAFACRCSMPSAFFFSSFLERNEVAPKRRARLSYSRHTSVLAVSSLAACAHSESRWFSGTTITHIVWENNKTLALYPRRQKQHRLINIFCRQKRKEKKIYRCILL